MYILFRVVFFMLNLSFTPHVQVPYNALENLVEIGKVVPELQPPKIQKLEASLFKQAFFLHYMIIVGQYMNLSMKNILPCTGHQIRNFSCYFYIVFHRINTPGAEAGKRPLSLSNIDEPRCADS